MGKASTMTFIAIIASIIGFSLFISAFPEGIKISHPASIYYEGSNVKFYGKIEGKGTAEIIAYNSSVVINNESFEGNIIINGSLSFSCPSALLAEGKILAKYVLIKGKNCWTYNGGKKFYETMDATIAGNLSINLKGKLYLNESSEENKSDLLPVDFSRIFPMKFNKIFFIDGKGKIEIDGMERNFTKYVFFRGEGEYDTLGKLNASGYLLAKDGKFYDNEKKIFFIPVKVFLLWIVAVVSFILSLIFKKNIFLERDKLFFGFSIVISILFFAISFFLWNCEMERIFGLNLFDIRNITIANVLFLSLAIVPYLVAIGIIGLPARIAISSIFEIVGLSNIGKGIGRCVGFMLTTFWGISLINSILNLTLSPLLRLI